MTLHEMKGIPMWRTILAASLLSAVGLSAVFVQGQPPAQRGVKEHEWLRQFIGEWTSRGEGTAEPGQPAMTCEGTTSSRPLGEFWVVSTIQIEMSGVRVDAFQTLGYDPNKKKYISTWIDSMVNHMWLSEGTVDTSGRILTLEADGPHMLVPGKTARFRDTYEFKSKDEIATTSSILGDDGKWVAFMTGTLKRNK
jgi:hypothetical protein